MVPAEAIAEPVPGGMVVGTMIAVMLGYNGLSEIGKVVPADGEPVSVESITVGTITDVVFKYNGLSETGGGIPAEGEPVPVTRIIVGPITELVLEYNGLSEMGSAVPADGEPVSVPGIKEGRTYVELAHMGLASTIIGDPVPAEIGAPVPVAGTGDAIKV
ncbi:hypothetical protein GQ44DRAFT_702374 [Phaeosphaeriaceae sp. PMI808]|nr:hypothetical protein GQ44DRAFT_702374 [Phaeosphaeriaceae sp. PMI808]